MKKRHQIDPETRREMDADAKLVVLMLVGDIIGFLFLLALVIYNILGA